MPIAFRTAATDSNSAGGTNTVAFARPASLQNGDLMVAAIAVSSGSLVSISTVPSGWTPVRRVDNGWAVGLAVYYKFAWNEPPNWVWELGSSLAHVGSLSVYAGVDRFLPIDAEGGRQESLGASQQIPSVRASVAGTMLVGCFAADTASSYTPPSGYVERADKSNTFGPTNATVAIADKLQAAAGATSAANATLGVVGFGANVVLALRPTVARYSATEALQIFQSLFPPGSEQLYDWTNTGSEFYKLLLAKAETYKHWGFDYADLVRQEFMPSSAVLKVGDWETALGTTPPASSATQTAIADRQSAVVGKLRESGAFTLANIRAAVEPLLGYDGADLGTLQIVECTRSSLTTAHTYSPASLSTIIPASGSVANTIAVTDDGAVSVAGARLVLTLSHANPDQLSVTLAGPSGSYGTASETIAAGWLRKRSLTNEATYWYALSSTLVGKSICGTWTVTVSTGTSPGTLHALTMFVEGVGALTASGGQGQGSEIFEWGAWADPTKVGPNPDYEGARRAIARLNPGHALGNIIRSSSTVGAGTLQAIPDDTACIPDQCIPV